MFTPFATAGAEVEESLGSPALSLLFTQCLLPRCHGHEKRKLPKGSQDRGDDADVIPLSQGNVGDDDGSDYPVVGSEDGDRCQGLELRCRVQLQRTFSRIPPAHVLLTASRRIASTAIGGGLSEVEMQSHIAEEA